MPNVDRVEVLSSIQLRRRYSLDQKLAVLAEAAHRTTPPKEGDQWRINFSRVEWKHEVVDGKYRKIKVQLLLPPGMPPLRVFARTGYYSPEN